MNTADISAIARNMYAAQGAKAIAEAAQKAAAFESKGDKVQAKIWQQVKAVLSEMQGPRES